MNDLLAHLRETLRARRLLRPGETLLVAVSGGVDSMVLLHLLRDLSSAMRWQLVVAHFNHGLRGRASAADSRFVVQTARRLGLPVLAEQGDVRRLTRNRRLSIEMAARELRHEFLSRAAQQAGARSIALAHHADDQVELFFLRLLRGSSSAGLSGMKWQSPVWVQPRGSRRSPEPSINVRLVRPLLDVSKAELLTYAASRGIRFREDASNAALDIQRNRIRHELLPLLRQHYQPALNQVVMRLMNLLAADAEALAAMHRRCRQDFGRRFANWPVAAQRLTLVRQIQERGFAADYNTVEHLRRHLCRPISLSSEVSALCTESGKLEFCEHRPFAFDDAEQTLSLRSGNGKAKFDGVSIQWRISRTGRKTIMPRQPGCECFDAAKVGIEVLLRHWRPGDRYQPIGMQELVKLQDWFTNRKLPRERRHQVIVAANRRGEIFWVEGERIDERFKVTDATRERLVWRWRR